MKLRLFFRKNEMGTVETAADGTLAYAGPNPDGVRGIIDYYAEVTGFAGDKLLGHVLRRVRGQTRAELVADESGI